MFVVHKSFPQLTTIDHDLYIDYNLIITLVKSQGCGKLLHFKNMKKQKLPLEKTHNIKEIISDIRLYKQPIEDFVTAEDIGAYDIIFNWILF